MIIKEYNLIFLLIIYLMILVKSEQHQSIDLTEQIKSSIIDIDRQHIVVFKIFGQKQFSFTAAYGKSISDWSAFYTQLNPEHSMRYLTKKWGDGSQFACLIKLRLNLTDNKRKIKLIQLSHPCLGNHSISGEYKANLIKKHLKQKYDVGFENGEPLMKKLGYLGILLQCMDCQDEQIIIPHDLCNEKHFNFQGLLKFKRSNDGMLRTIGWQPYNQPLENQIWNKVSGQQQFEPYLLLKCNKEIKNLILEQK